MLAATVDAKAVAEIGTGTGVSGIHLLHGMRPDGVLTTVDPEPEHQQFARQAFRACGFASNRARFIPGRALDVLPRLADAGYDLVFCDGDRLEFLDYLAESLRLLRPGGLVVFEGVFTNGRTVDLEVEDHGIGIPAADLERIFERFYRVDQARSRQTGGTGLGLAIVRHVATNHDGDVRVESRAGEGSTFSLRFPAAAGPVAVSEAG